jgi:very-short-patch-repair endonuclease
MDVIRKDCDTEKLLEDSKKLKMFEKEIKFNSQSNINELHIKFMCENLDLVDVHDVNIVKRVFDFLKKNA